MMAIDELLIDFDEMGFVPTTLCENPDEYARDWKKQLLVEIKRLKAENEQLKAKLEARLTCDFVKTAQKQAKIDVLNELKKYSYCDNDFMDGKWHRYVLVDDIDELIKEIENADKD